MVAVVVEMVASQPWYPPPTYTSAISFSAVAAPVHSAVSTNEAPKPHAIAGSAPAGPRNSRVAAVSAVPESRSVPGMFVESQEIVPVAVWYNPRIVLSTATSAVQLVSECNDSGDEVQATAASKPVLVGMVVAVVVVVVVGVVVTVVMVVVVVGVVVTVMVAVGVVVCDVVGVVGVVEPARLSTRWSCWWLGW